jgi:hypothetical protein
LDCAPWAFGFAENVMVIRGRKLHADAHASAHMAGDSNLKDRVRVEVEDRCERA